jgi:hypothetical protein
MELFLAGVELDLVARVEPIFELSPISRVDGPTRDVSVQQGAHKFDPVRPAVSCVLERPHPGSVR